MQDATEKTCEERIGARLESRLADILPNWAEEEGDGGVEPREWAKAEGYSLSGEDWDELLEEAKEKQVESACGSVLSVETLTVKRVLLSCGGLTDGFEFTYSGGELTRCEYWFVDWFDGARRPVALDVAERLAELWAISPEYDG